jgi:hypothetical protein
VLQLVVLAKARVLDDQEVAVKAGWCLSGFAKEDDGRIVVKHIFAIAEFMANPALSFPRGVEMGDVVIVESERIDGFELRVERGCAGGV